MNRLPIRRLPALAGAFALAASLHAATLTYTYTCDLAGNTTGGDTLPSFDPSLGTLTSVTLTNVLNANVSQTVTNTGVPSDFEIFTAAFTSFFIVDASGAYIAGTDSGDGVDETVHLGTGESFTQTYVGSPAPFYYGYLATAHPNGVYSAPDELARFRAGGLLTVLNQAYPDFEAFPADPSATFTQDTNGAGLGTFAVTYDYQPVPEPASLAAFGLGALAVLRRNRPGKAR